MRKTLRTALASVLGTALVSATMVGSASTAYAADCGTATPLGVEARTGTLSDTTPEVWWSHSVDADDRVVSLALPAGSATLQVRDASCSTVLCTDRASAAETAQCTLEQADDVRIGVLGDAAGIVSNLPWTYAYVLDELNHVPGCNDGEDNDFDGATDWPHDPHCTSASDNTEAQTHIPAYGSIEIKTDAGGTPRMSLGGIFSPEAKKFTCWDPAPITGGFEVECTQLRDTEFFYVCRRFTVEARAFSVPVAPLGKGATKGSLACDSGNAVTTGEVDSRYDLEKTVSTADSWAPHVQLGSAIKVRCRALGVKNESTPAGHYTVTCK